MVRFSLSGPEFSSAQVLFRFRRIYSGLLIYLPTVLLELCYERHEAHAKKSAGSGSHHDRIFYDQVRKVCLGAAGACLGLPNCSPRGPGVTKFWLGWEGWETRKVLSPLDRSEFLGKGDCHEIVFRDGGEHTEEAGRLIAYGQEEIT